MTNSRIQLLYFAAGGIYQGVASLYPDTAYGACLTWAAVLCLCVGIRFGTESLFRSFFTFGMCFGLIAFYWLSYTIHFFGGFPWWLAGLLCFGFTIFSTLQFVLCAWLYIRFAKGKLGDFHLALPLAWFVSETLFPRLFPWTIAHTQIVWTSFASLAEFGGAFPLGFLMFFWAQILLDWYFERSPRNPRFAAAAASISILLLCVGIVRSRFIAEYAAASPSFRAGLIQGNLAARDKGDIRLLEVNLDRYRELSTIAVAKGAELLLWPETVVNEWYREDIKAVSNTKLEPFPGSNIPILYGALSYRVRKTSSFVEEDNEISRFNSGVGLNSLREVVGMYHKRVLMPFGEFIPFAETFPMLKALSPQTGDLQVGDRLDPVVFAADQTAAGVPIAASVLICYEDLVPDLSAEGVRRGGNVLVNLTNDAWYGHTHAPYQHHLLAMWRAVEDRRYLLRVTNTGLTAVVSPLGETVASLPIFDSGLLVEKVALLNIKTLHARLGELPARSMAWIMLVYAVIFLRNRRRLA